MRTRHFEHFRPVCPVCRGPETEAPLRITHVTSGDDERILEGLLACSNPSCQHEYPILDGVPILVPNLRQYVSDNLLAIHGRADLSPTLSGVLGDCCGPGSAYDTLRQHLSSYAWGHYGNWDPEEKDWDEQASVHTLMQTAIEHAGETAGPLLDAGCGVGGATLTLGATTDKPVLGVDTNFSMLRLAQRVLRTGAVDYPRRRCGVVYDQRRFELPMEPPQNVDFWACDLTALPLPHDTFSAAIGLNTLDSVASPLSMLVNLRDALTVGGNMVLACPYDWSGAATPIEQWIGGHSGRGDQRGASDKILEDLLTPGGRPGSIDGLQLVQSVDDLRWRVRWQERGMIDYRLHLVVAEKTSTA